MEIRHLKLVKTVAETGNLTHAGKMLFLSQSALSHQLKEVETELGIPLFHRVNKKMVLTQAGARVLETAENVLDELEKTKRDIQKRINGDTGEIRISTECYTCYHWLPSLLCSYNKHYPNVDIIIEASSTRKPLQSLKDGKLEIALVSCLAPIDSKSPLHYTKLFTDEMMLVVHRDHPYAAKELIYPQDFTNEHLICYTAPMTSLDIFQRVLIPAGVEPEKTTKIQLTEAIIEMVKANMGITVMAGWAVRPYLKSGELVTIPVAGRMLKRNWYAATLDNPPAYVACFIQHLIAQGISE